MTYGGWNWVDYINEESAGINDTATAVFKADNASETYHAFFDQRQSRTPPCTTTRTAPQATTKCRSQIKPLKGKLR